MNEWTLAPIAADGPARRFAVARAGAPCPRPAWLAALAGGEVASPWLASRAGPLWVGTSGLAVPWLHARLDARPKYYSYAPYRVWP